MLFSRKQLMELAKQVFWSTSVLEREIRARVLEANESAGKYRFTNEEAGLQPDPCYVFMGCPRCQQTCKFRAQGQMIDASCSEADENRLVRCCACGWQALGGDFDQIQQLRAQLAIRQFAELMPVVEDEAIAYVIAVARHAKQHPGLDIIRCLEQCDHLHPGACGMVAGMAYRWNNEDDKGETRVLKPFGNPTIW